jgi:predicted ester cyclase
MWVRNTRAMMPDLTLSPRLIFAENDRVMVHVGAEGTYRGMPAVAGPETRLAFTVTALARLAEGKIAECLVIADTLAILQQLGEVEPVG